MSVDTSMLNAEQLIEAARAETGLDDFGDALYEQRVRRYCAAVVEIGPTYPGVIAQVAALQRLLTNRLRVEEDLKSNPEIIDEEIIRPIVITGLPRTGTTKLQRMLSADPGTQGLWLWRIQNPARPDGADLRLTTAQAQGDLISSLHPDFTTVHALLADQVDEDFWLQEFTLDSLANAIIVPSKTYLWELADRPRVEVYGYVRRLLQYLQWQDGGGRGRPWIMKSPLHLGDLPALLEVFPGATVVHCHRDLLVTLPSIVRMMEVGANAFCTEVDRKALGRMWVEFWAHEMRQYLLDRDRLGAPIIDVDYSAICDDGMGVIGEVYRQRKESISAEGGAAMAAWEQENPQHRHGTNTYSVVPEEFGYTRAEIEEAFAPYIERFGSFAAG